MSTVIQAIRHFSILRKRIFLTADSIVEDENGAILFIKRKTEPFKGHWGLPGGFVKYREEVETAAVREVKEETGIDVRLRGLHGVYSKFGRDPRGHVVTVCFVADKTGGALRTSRETTEVKFLAEIPTMLAFDHSEILQSYLKSKIP
ncbi:MAG: NUDIX domain-containing protein [Candidatus Bathyarchaeia archaeon]